MRRHDYLMRETVLQHAITPTHHATTITQVIEIGLYNIFKTAQVHVTRTISFTLRYIVFLCFFDVAANPFVS
jgi:hypothetical protein